MRHRRTLVVAVGAGVFLATSPLQAVDYAMWQKMGRDQKIGYVIGVADGFEAYDPDLSSDKVLSIASKRCGEQLDDYIVHYVDTHFSSDDKGITAAAVVGDYFSRVITAGKGCTSEGTPASHIE